MTLHEIERELIILKMFMREFIHGRGKKTDFKVYRQYMARYPLDVMWRTGQHTWSHERVEIDLARAIYLGTKSEIFDVRPMHYLSFTTISREELVIISELYKDYVSINSSDTNSGIAK
jgi:hypothetical protein